MVSIIIFYSKFPIIHTLFLDIYYLVPNFLDDSSVIYNTCKSTVPGFVQNLLISPEIKLYCLKVNILGYCFMKKYLGYLLK